MEQVENTVTKHRKSDILWKVIMEEVFDDFLRFILPDADQEYNMDKGFEFLEQEFSQLFPEPEQTSDTRYADKLIKVHNRKGKEEYVLIHVEFQGETSKREEFTERMFRYFYRILEKHKKPIMALAIFTGENAKNMPDRYTYEYRKTRLLYKYNTLCILDYTDEELKASNNPFALVLLTAKTALLEEKIPEEELLRRKLLIAKELFKKGYPNKKVRAILTFLDNYVLFEKKEMNRIFTEQVHSFDKNKTMNLDEFLRQQGREEVLEQTSAAIELMKQQLIETSKNFVSKLLARSNFSDAQIADIADVSLSFVEEIRSARH